MLSIVSSKYLFFKNCLIRLSDVSHLCNRSGSELQEVHTLQVCNLLSKAPGADIFLHSEIFYFRKVIWYIYHRLCSISSWVRGSTLQSNTFTFLHCNLWIFTLHGINKGWKSLFEISSGLVLLPHELWKTLQSFLFSELQMGDCRPVFLYSLKHCSYVWVS